jgi:hypothetical protein
MGSDGGCFNKLGGALGRKDLELFFLVPCFHGDGKDGKNKFDSDLLRLGAPDGSGAHVVVWLSEAVDFCGVPKRRQLCAIVILGKSNHSVLGCNTYLCIFFLQAYVPSRRIFFDLDAGARLAPSGIVFGGVAGARI